MTELQILPENALVLSHLLLLYWAILKPREGLWYLTVRYLDRVADPLLDAAQKRSKEKQPYLIHLKATPSCSSSQLLELMKVAIVNFSSEIIIYEQTPVLQYLHPDFLLKAKTVEKIRQCFWNSSTLDLDKYPIYFVISQAEYLSPSALQEIRDLSVRVGFNFLLLSDRPELKKNLNKAEGRDRFTSVFPQETKDRIRLILSFGINSSEEFIGTIELGKSRDTTKNGLWKEYEIDLDPKSFKAGLDFLYAQNVFPQFLEELDFLLWSTVTQAKQFMLDRFSNLLAAAEQELRSRKDQENSEN